MSESFQFRRVRAALALRRAVITVTAWLYFGVGDSEATFHAVTFKLVDADSALGDVRRDSDNFCWCLTLQERKVERYIATTSISVIQLLYDSSSFFAETRGQSCA